MCPLNEFFESCEAPYVFVIESSSFFLLETLGERMDVIINFSIDIARCIVFPFFHKIIPLFGITFE